MSFPLIPYIYFLFVLVVVGFCYIFIYTCVGFFFFFLGGEVGAGVGGGGGVLNFWHLGSYIFLIVLSNWRLLKQPINFTSLVCKGKIWANVWTVRGVPAGAEIEGSRNINRTGMAEEKNADEGMLESLYFPCFHMLSSFYTSYSKDLCAFVVL